MSHELLPQREAVKMAKMTKAEARRAVQASIGKLSRVRDSGHLTTAHMDKLYSIQKTLMNLATKLK